MSMDGPSMGSADMTLSGELAKFSSAAEFDALIEQLSPPHARALSEALGFRAAFMMVPFFSADGASNLSAFVRYAILFGHYSSSSKATDLERYKAPLARVLHEVQAHDTQAQFSYDVVHQAFDAAFKGGEIGDRLDANKAAIKFAEMTVRRFAREAGPQVQALSTGALSSLPGEGEAAIATSAFWSHLSNDAHLISIGEANPSLALRPLHMIGRLSEQRWLKLKADLIAGDPNWQFWTDWYEQRLKGGPQSAAFERAFLSLSEEEWKGQPAAVNALLMERQREFEAEDEEEAPAPAFTSIDAVEQWLAKQPKHKRPDIDRALAARLALRLAPRFAAETPNDLCQAFRGHALAFGAILGVEPSAFADRHAAYFEGQPVTRGSARSIAELAVNSAVGALCSGALPIREPWQELFWERLSDDIAALEAGRAARQLALDPIVLFDDAAADDWHGHKLNWLADDPNARVWSDWFDERLDGGPQSPAFEHAFLSLTPDDWEQAPETINALLAKRMDEFEAGETDQPDPADPVDDDTPPEMPPQDPRGLAVEIGPDGKVRLQDVRATDNLLDDPSVARIVERVLRRADALATRCRPMNSASNLLPKLDELRALLKAGGNAFATQPDRFDVWEAINGLRIYLDSDLKATAKKDVDRITLDSHVRDDLQALVNNLNLLANHMPEGPDWDDGCRNPIPQTTRQDQREVIEKLNSAALEDGIIDEELADANQRMIENSNGEGATEAGQLTTAEKTQKNIFARMFEWLSEAHDKVEKGEKIAKTAVRLVEWINKNLPMAQAFLEKASHRLLDVLNWLMNLPWP